VRSSSQLVEPASSCKRGISQPMLPAAAPYKDVCALPMDAAKAVVNSFVISRVDYCNSLLAGAPRYQRDRLQSVLNTAARLLVGAKKHDHIRHVTCAAGPPPLAVGPAARPVQAVPADVQSASRTCTDVPRRSVSTSGIGFRQTRTTICHSRRPRHQPNCHALWCPVIRRSSSSSSKWQL